MVCRCHLGEAEADRDEGLLMFMFLPASISPSPAFLSSNIFSTLHPEWEGMAVKKHSPFIYPSETGLERSVTYNSDFLLCFRLGMETS